MSAETTDSGAREDEKNQCINQRTRQKPRHVNISDSLTNLQKTVDGFIETVTIATDLVVICNEEGIIRNLPYNCTICGAKLYGTIIMCGVNGDEFSDLPTNWDNMKRLFPMLFES